MFTSVLNGAVSSLSITAVLLCLAASVICGLLIALVYRACEHPNKGFSLVRFRSLPGKASDILIIFLAMGIGLCTGMGYIWFALAATIAVCALYLIYAKTGILDADGTYRNIRINMPEDLDYTNVFDEVFKKYTTSYQIESVRTLNLGTMFQAEYSIRLKNAAEEKTMIDQIRVRNGNLPVICGRASTIAGEL